jgi:hypothetical protein
VRPVLSRVACIATFAASAFAASCFSITQPTGGGCGGSFLATLTTSSPYPGGGLQVTFEDDGTNPIPILQVGDTVSMVANAPDGCDPSTLPADTWTFDTPDSGAVVITPTGLGAFGMLLKPTHAGMVRLHARFGSGAIQTFRVQVNRRAKSISVDPADTTLATAVTRITMRVTVTDSSNVTITPPWTVWVYVAPTPTFVVPPFDLHTIGSPRLLELEGVVQPTTIITGLGALRDTAVVHPGP